MQHSHAVTQFSTNYQQSRQDAILFNIHTNLKSMDAHSQQMTKDNYNTHGFIEKLKRRADHSPVNRQINFSLAEEMSQLSRKPYSTRNRSI